MKIEILDQTKKVLKDNNGREFVFETAVVQIGQAHKWLFITSDDWLLSYKLEMIPGVDFRPEQLEQLIGAYVADIAGKMIRKNTK